MITFKQFISEDEKEVYGFDRFKHIAEWLHTDCAKFLSESGGHPLYRGMKIFSDEGAPLDALRISHPENRIPKDSGELFNDIFNRAMEKKFGIADIRRKTVFASGSVNQAKLYGQIFYFFPIGDFKFTYAPDVEDSYEEGRKLWQNVGNALSGHKRDLIRVCPFKIKEDDFESYGKMAWMVNGYSLKRIFKRASDAGLFKTLPENPSRDDMFELAGIVSSIIDSDERYFEGEDKDEFYDQLRQALTEWWPLIYSLTLKTFTNSYQTDTALSDAIKSNVEIFFYSTKGYYVISTQKVKKLYVDHHTDTPDEDGNTGALHNDYHTYKGEEDTVIYEWFINLGKKHGTAD